LDVADTDAQFLVQLARQRGRGVLAGLDLAAGEFPVAGIKGSGRTAPEQERAVTADEHARGNFHTFAHRLKPDPRGRRSRARTGWPRGPSGNRAAAPTAGPPDARPRWPCGPCRRS